MSFIQDLIAPGARQMGDAAQTASEGQKAIQDKLLDLQTRLMGFVQNADKSGMFDPEKAAERFDRDWQANHATDLEQTGAALRHSGLRPGDSELDYGLNKEKARLDQDRYAGMDNARVNALASKLNAYGMTSAPLNGASSAGALAGHFGTQAGQLRQQGQESVYSRLTGLYSGIAPWLRRQTGGGGGNEVYNAH